MSNGDKLTTVTAKGNINTANITSDNVVVNNRYAMDISEEKLKEIFREVVREMLSSTSETPARESAPRRRVFEYSKNHGNGVYTVNMSVNYTDTRMRCVIAGDFWYVAAVGDQDTKIIFSGNNASEEIEVIPKR